ncbi:MAG: response regulator [Xanthobacteraceae bacterium]
MRRILVLDDEPLIAMMVEEWLLELGCETIGPANSVAAALSLIDGNDLEGAILDVTLGDENCYSVADALNNKNVPFAFATGRGAGGVDSRYKDVMLLAKPFDFAAIKGIVAKFPNRTGAV